MLKLVSIIVPCFNQACFLGDALQSALEQDYPLKEIITVNDGSTDNTREVVLSFGDAIQYLEQPNRGVSSARNLGILRSKGAYIALLDGDDVYLPDALGTMVSYLEAHPDIALVCGDAIYFKGNETLGLRSRIGTKPKSAGNFRWETVTYNPPTSTIMVRRACFDRAGLFDESLRAAEDWLMWVRMSLYFNMAYIEQPLARCRRHDNNMTRDIESINTAHRIAVTKIVDTPYFLLYPPVFRAMLLFFRGVAAWRTEGNRKTLHYFLNALRTHPRSVFFGARLICRGMTNTLRRFRRS